MDDEEFQDFLDSAQQELSIKQDSLQESYGLGSFPRWSFDQQSHKLQFFGPADQLIVEADIVEIGSFSGRSNTWKWAWANDAVVASLRQRAEPLRALTEFTGFEVFSEASPFEIEGEAMAWELAAMSVKHLGAVGCYKASSSSKPLHTFLAIMKIRRAAA